MKLLSLQVQTLKQAIQAQTAIGVDIDACLTAETVYDDLKPDMSDSQLPDVEPFDLGPRWTSMTLSPDQRAYYLFNGRFVVVPAGRRTGKSEIAKRRGVSRAMGPQLFDDALYVFAAPTYNQAKSIFWSDLKRLVLPEFLESEPSEGALSIRLKNGATIRVVGLDKPERIEGTPLNGIILDEYGNMKPETWSQHVRPMLADRCGWADFIGVPEGRNHYYDLWMDAQADTTKQWGHYTWTTESILPLYLGDEAAAMEIAQAKHDLDPISYAQEYLADFVTFSGRAYYAFKTDDITRGGNLTQLEYDEKLPLIFCFDFNVKPGTAVVLQEQRLENEVISCIIGEVFIPDNSTSERVCKKLIEDWGHHKLGIQIYGDPAGGHRSTQSSLGTDWKIIKEILSGHFPIVHSHVSRSDPGHRARVNALNARCRATDETRRLFVDPRKSPFTVKDFEGVVLVKGGALEIDKDATPMLTHLTDGLAYYAHRRFGVRGKPSDFVASQEI